MFYLFFGSQSFLYRTLLTIVYFSLGPAQDDLVEEQNERLAQELAGKVSRLKNVSYYI